MPAPSRWRWAWRQRAAPSMRWWGRPSRSSARWCCWPAPWRRSSPASAPASGADAECGLEPGEVLGAEHDPVAGGDVDEVEVDAGVGDVAGEVGEDTWTVVDLDH